MGLTEDPIDSEDVVENFVEKHEGHVEFLFVENLETESDANNVYQGYSKGIKVNMKTRSFHENTLDTVFEW